MEKRSKFYFGNGFDLVKVVASTVAHITFRHNDISDRSSVESFAQTYRYCDT